MQTKPLLDVQNLYVSYQTPRGPLMAVNGVSFALNRGETFGLVGESGSGKTTVANAILRLLGSSGRVEGGRVLLDGVDLLTLPEEQMRLTRWSEVALIPQGAMNSLNPVMRIRDQIEDTIRAHEPKADRKATRARIAQLLQSVGLAAGCADMFPHELSGGMKQRVCIAMAIALKPKLIIADEPTSALDVVVQRIVAETLKDVQRRLNATVILIGHDMGIQAQMVDRLGIMYQGQLVELGPVRAIFKSPQHQYTRRLIASIPSIKRQTTLAQRLEQAEARGNGTVDAADTALDAALECIPPLREIAPGHFAAV